MSKQPLPAPTHIACESMKRTIAQLEVDLLLAFAGIYDPDAVRLAIADICFRRAVAAGLTDAPEPHVIVRDVRKRR